MANNIRLQIKRVTNDLNKGISQRVGEVAFAGFSAILIDSPVLSGHFRNNWQVSINDRKTDELAGFDKSGSEAAARARPVIANYEMGIGSKVNIIIFSNNVPYAKGLNEGRAIKKPAGFVQRALRAGVKAVGASGNIFKP
jgi:hypothetical protein